MKTFTTAKCFVDTNVLIYALDRDEPVRQRRARDVLQSLPLERRVISTQVLTEFAAVALKRARLSAGSVSRLIELHRRFEVIQVTPAMIADALEIADDVQINFFDALILAAAVAARCDVLLTEDLNDGQIIRGVRIANPFTAA